MSFPDRIERTVELAHPPGKVWAALTTAEGLGTWFGNEATIDLGPGEVDRRAHGRPAGGTRGGADGVRVHLAHLWAARGGSAPDLCRVHARTGRRGHPADR